MQAGFCEHVALPVYAALAQLDPNLHTLQQVQIRTTQSCLLVSLMVTDKLIHFVFCWNHSRFTRLLGIRTFIFFL